MHRCRLQWKNIQRKNTVNMHCTENASIECNGKNAASTAYEKTRTAYAIDIAHALEKTQVSMTKSTTCKIWVERKDTRNKITRIGSVVRRKFRNCNFIDQRNEKLNQSKWEQQSNDQSKKDEQSYDVRIAHTAAEFWQCLQFYNSFTFYYDFSWSRQEFRWNFLQFFANASGIKIPSMGIIESHAGFQSDGEELQEVQSWELSNFLGYFMRFLAKIGMDFGSFCAINPEIKIPSLGLIDSHAGSRINGMKIEEIYKLIVCILYVFAVFGWRFRRWKIS